MIIDEEVPGAALPQTGGAGTGIFYGLGALLTALGVRLRKNN
ncbi:MAG: LPXTG cell wall anchor domain-containing protein [Eubacteriales bacterium]|nr:LPXTG cell wall anchor domain-containing protein [Eubacteriales bacterium]